MHTDRQIYRQIKNEREIYEGKTRETFPQKLSKQIDDRSIDTHIDVLIKC